MHGRVLIDSNILKEVHHRNGLQQKDQQIMYIYSSFCSGDDVIQKRYHGIWWEPQDYIHNGNLPFILVRSDLSKILLCKFWYFLHKIYLFIYIMRWPSKIVSICPVTFRATAKSDFDWFLPLIILRTSSKSIGFYSNPTLTPFSWELEMLNGIGSWK